ncbi:MAG: hypothetical protein H6595_12920 [Flavobacteriales bacterium]|nr:hypothetical protein [Flavobacteriales bacterium]MCB9168366.1 hypothetical protein [Flavobacteriales bacterium]
MGELLFVANHADLYNAQEQIMPNGQGPFTHDPNGNVTQGSVILPYPGHPSRYEVVYLHHYAYGYWPGAEHLTVDMTLDGGLGDVVPGSRETFSDSLTEKLTGIPHADGVDYWVLMHGWDTDAFLAFLLDPNGLDTVPVVSHAGSRHVRFWQLPNFNNNYQGQMKTTIQGDRIALTTSNSNSPQPYPCIVELFDFDAANGQVDYIMGFPDHSRAYGIEFSPDGSKLYVSGLDSMYQYLDQYDLSLDDTLAIQNSRTRIYAFDISGVIDPAYDRPDAMEQAPDGRIYVTRAYTNNPWFAIIDQPNEAGLACNFVWNGLDVSPATLLSGHCNQLKRYHDSEYTVGIHEPVSRPALGISPNPLDALGWIDMPGLKRNVEVVWRDGSGRTVLDRICTASGFGVAVDASGLAEGLYMVELWQKGERKGVLKAVVAR